MYEKSVFKENIWAPNISVCIANCLGLLPIIQEDRWAPGLFWRRAEIRARPPPEFDVRTIQSTASQTLCKPQISHR